MQKAEIGIKIAEIHISIESSRPWRRIRNFVGGEGRFCTELMEAFDGEVVEKVGADGFVLWDWG